MKNPAHTRVSYQDSDMLALNELTIFADIIFAKHIRHAYIGDVPYVLFDCEQPFSASASSILSRLSFVYAIFEVLPCEDTPILKPIALTPNYFIAPELSTILKYSGKTNELFTRLMLNIAQTQIKNPPESLNMNLNILDPLAGKGTTLYEALMQGHNAYGVEIDAKIAGESVVYLKKYLETARYKHENHTEKISGQSLMGKFTAVRNQIKISPPKAKQDTPVSPKPVEGYRHFEIVAGDTRNTSAYFKKNHFHAIIADLPYGVQHSSKKPQNIGFTRNALGLISEAMPSWVRVLKPGGVIVLAWNLFLISKAEMAELLTQHGFAIPDLGVDFSHRVDQAIDRDFIVGVL